MAWVCAEAFGDGDGGAYSGGILVGVVGAIEVGDAECLDGVKGLNAHGIAEVGDEELVIAGLYPRIGEGAVFFEVAVGGELKLGKHGLAEQGGDDLGNALGDEEGG